MQISLSKTVLLSLGLIVGLTASAKAAGDLVLTPGLFIDATLGANVGQISDFTFSNPRGVANATSPTSGDTITMDSTDESDIVIGGKLAIGNRYPNNVLVRVSYAYVDEMEYEGFASFGNSFQQLMTVEAHNVMLELGYDLSISDKMYVEGFVSAGLAIVSTDGVQGLNQGNNNPFPGNTRVNPAVGVGLGLGYQLSENWGFMVTSDYTHLGRASTGRSGAAEVAASGNNMNLSEELSADLSVWRTMAGLRYQF